MNILVVNDDGIKAKGIKLLATALKKYGNVYVLAPDRGRSAASHSIILHSPIEVKKVDEIEGCICYQASGMPSDCVRLATGILNVNFDIVFSGVNDGLNIGTDIIYSGTVAAAREAVIEGIPAVAISTDFGAFEIVERELDKLLELVFSKNLYSNEYILNINYPTSEFNSSKGYKVAIQGKKIFNSRFKAVGENIYDVDSEEIIHDVNPETDVYLADEGYITLVPLRIDQTSYHMLEKLNQKIA